jgi:hypothetical protein
MSLKSLVCLFVSLFGEVVIHFFELQTSRVIEFIITRNTLLRLLKPLGNIRVFTQVKTKNLKRPMRNTISV